MTEGQEPERTLEERFEERRKEVRSDIVKLTETTEILAEEVKKNTERNEANERLVKKTSELVSDVKILAKRNQILAFTVLVLVLVIGALGVGNFLSDKKDDQRLENIQALTRSNEELTNVISGCINPKGQCRKLQLEVQRINDLLNVKRFREEQLQTSLDAAVIAGNENTTGQIYKRDLIETRKTIEDLQKQIESLTVVP